MHTVHLTRTQYKLFIDRQQHTVGDASEKLLDGTSFCLVSYFTVIRSYR
jgi:hypothetical protein